MRLSVAGGRDSTTRTVLTALGIAFGVAMLLLASSIPTARHHRDERIHQRIDHNLSRHLVHASQHTVLISDIDTVFRGEAVRGRLVEPEGPRAPLPPGLDHYPRPGEMIVSPALAELLDKPGNGLLRERLDHPVVGSVADEGLLGPSEYVFFLGGEGMADGTAGARRLDHFGKYYPRKPLDPALALLTVAGSVALLAPVAVFLAAAARFGGERRDRRLAAMRLIGADRAMTARIAAGEALSSSLLGTLAGAALFLAGRQLAGGVNFQGLSFFVADLAPVPALAVLVVLVVPGLSLVVTRLAMDKVMVEPLGVVRGTGRNKRRLWWRVALPVLGLALLQTSLTKSVPGQNIAAFTAVIVGMLALLIGVTVVLPWLLERLAELAGGRGPVAWQLAIRRMKMSSEASTRPVNGIVVAVAGAIALQILFTGITAGDAGGREPARGHGAAPRTEAGVAQLAGDSGRPGRYAQSFSSTPGVRSAVGVAELSVMRAHDGYFSQTVLVADCAHLRLLADLATCTETDAFLLVPPGTGGQDDLTTWTPGTLMRVGGDAEAARWRVPRITSTVGVPERSPLRDLSERTLLATPRAAGAAVLTHATTSVRITYDKGHPDVQDLIRTAGARMDPRFSVVFPARAKGDLALAGIQRALLAGVAVVLLLIAASMLISALEQIRERKRLLAILMAFGTRRRTLGYSVLWQTMVPVVVGLVIAALVGTVLGSALLGTVGRTAGVDWEYMLAMCGLGLAAVVLVTLLTLPTLWRSTRSDGLRYE
ncbi:FtsX-like permease family protein [Streptomyces sp. NPDC060030]|uniref:FtsX-like permease family protein n=1 Tax=Streptomyces sp. NPDC060030 TaxID=3347042 RepID=UPI00367A3FA2